MWLVVHLIWLADVTVRFQVSNYSQLSDFNPTQQLVKNKAVNAPIKFEKIVMVMIRCETVHSIRGGSLDSSLTASCEILPDLQNSAIRNSGALQFLDILLVLKAILGLDVFNVLDFEEPRI